MTIRLTAAALCAAALTACQSTQDSATNSAFRTPNANGFITSGFESSFNSTARKVSDNRGGGYAYSVGNARNDEGFVGYAGLIPGTTVSAQPTRGSATYNASYTMLTIEGINLNGSFLTGNGGARSGDIILRADFGANTLRGSDGRLTVRGELNNANANFGGNVTYNGVRGALRGKAGENEVVGAFHGNNANLIYAGGFLGDAR